MSDLYKSAEEAGLEVRRIGQGKPYTPGQLYRERTGRDYAPGDVSQSGLTPPEVRRRGIAAPNQEISPEQQEFLQGLLTETPAPEAKPAEQGFLGKAADLAVQGAKNTLTAVRVAPGIVSGNIDPETAGLIAEQYARPQVERPAELKEAEGAFAPAAEQWKEADGFMQGAAAIGSMVLAVGKQAVTNPKGVAYLTSEQLGNMIPSLVGMYAGAKIGAATGLVTPVPGGAAAGAVVGGIAGGFAGGAPVEIGSEFVGIVGKALQDMKVAPTQENIAALLSDQQFLTKAINDARVKGATTAGIDAALTLGAGSIATAPGRTALKTATKELGADASAAQITQRAKEILASRTLGQKVATGTKATGAEIIGEPISEAGGQAAAYGEIDLEQVGQEMLGGVGGAAMSVPTAAASLKDSRLRGDQKIVTDKSGPVTVSYPVDANGDPVRDANVDAAANNLTAAVDQYVSPSVPVNSQAEPVSAVQESNVPAPQSVRERQLQVQREIDGERFSTTPTQNTTSVEERQRAVQQQVDAENPIGTPIVGPQQTVSDRQSAVQRQIDGFEPRATPATSPENEAAQLRAAANPSQSARDFADLTPLSPMQAQQRLAVMRSEAELAGQDPMNLVIAPHPAQANALAIQRLPAFQYTPELQGNRQERGFDPVRNYLDQQRQENTPAARQFIKDYEAGRINDGDVLLALDRKYPTPSTQPNPNDRIAAAASQAPSQEGGIAIETGMRARPAPSLSLRDPESALQNRRRSGDAVDINLPAADPQPSAPRQAQQFVQGLRQENTPRARAIVRAYEAGRMTDADVMEVMRAESPATFAPSANERIEAAATAGRLAKASSGRIVSTDAKFSNKRAPVPGSTLSIKDGDTEHALNVVPTNKLGARGKILEQIGRIFGKKLAVFESDTLEADGFVLNSDSNTIFVNANAQTSPLAVFGHELLHQLKRDNPQAYIALEAVIKRNIKESPEMDAEYSGYDADARAEELAADLVGNRFQEGEFWSDVFNEINSLYPEQAKGIIQRLVEALVKAVDAFKAATQARGFKADEFVSDLDAVKKAITDTFVQYAQEQRPVAQEMAARAPESTATPEDISGADVTFAETRDPKEFKATQQDAAMAEEYEERTGMEPYTSAGQVTIPLEAEGARFSIKRAYGEKEFEKGRANDPLTGLPLNKNGTVTLYFPTNNATARELAKTKKLKPNDPKANRIYLTNESSGPAVMNERGNIEQDMDGANVLLQVDPALLHLDQEFENGRKDFFIPIAEGKEFQSKMTRLFTLDAPRTKALSKDTKLTDLERRIDAGLSEYLQLDGADRRARLKEARAVLKEQHNVGTLLGVNGKLEKTNTGGYGLNNYNGKDVMSMGLGLASAQKINEQNLSTCPKSAICEGLCLGETSGQNLLYGGDGQFKSGPRLAQYLKTEAMVVHPEEFAIVLHAEIEKFQRAAAKEEYQPTVRLNVTSDFRPKTFEAIINAFPGVMFYDYTKLPTNTIAPNHHLTYSSTGASQVVNGKTIVNPETNWDRMVNDRLMNGMNVAMAFTSRTDMPDFILDERTGERFQVWNGDNYDARFLDPKPNQEGNLLSRGMIIGLTNKDKTTKPEEAAEKHKGFFLDYDRERDGDTLVIRNQKALSVRESVINIQPISAALLDAVNDESAADQAIKFSLRRKPDPEKTVTAYKLFRVNEKKPGQLFPLFIGKNEPVETGIWYDADDIPTSGFASRPGWHAGDLPMATHIGEKSKSGLKAPDRRPANQVWAEISMSADKDWQPEANKRGTNKKGVVIAARADIKDQIPEDGFYRYKTNPNMTGNWLIGGSIKVNRILSDAEVEAINSAAGAKDLKRDAPFDAAKYGFDSAPATQEAAPVAETTPAPATNAGAPQESTREDILASRRRPQVKENIFGERPEVQWTVPEMTAMDNRLRYWQDTLVDTKRVVQTINQQVGAIDDKFDPYLKEELFYGRAAGQTKDFLAKEVKPLMQEIARRNVTPEELEAYLHNRHAETRNKVIAERNPSMPDGGSGITTADARAYLANLSDDKRANLEALAGRIDAITKGTREVLVASGLETKESIKQWEEQFPDYVPLNREEGDFNPRTGSMGTGSGFSVTGGTSKRAKGSTAGVVDILANVMQQRERAIVRAEKNRVSTSVFGLAASNPNPDFWLAVKPNAINDPDLDAKLMALGLDPQDARGLMADPKRGREYAIGLRIDGQDHFVFFNNNNERAKSMVESLKNVDADQLGRVMSMIGGVTRYFSSINTQYNPIFGIVNLIRDSGAGTLNLTTTPISDKKAQVVGDILPALKGIYGYLRAVRRGDPAPKGKWAEVWEQFSAAGGKTGYRDQYSNSAERARALNSELKQISEGTLKSSGRALFDWLSDFNETFENAVRLSAFKAALDKGISTERAASIAKNLTVNFNKKGEVAQQAGALYAFFNASVQGSKRTIETLGGPAGKKIIAGGIALGALQALALSMAGYEDDDPPEFLRERNFIIPTGRDEKGKATYYMFPYPLGFNVLPNAGRVMTEWALNDFKDPGKRVVQIAGSLLETFNPIGNSGMSLQTLTPTILDPAIALAENRDFSGKPIYKKNMSELDPTPGYLRARDTASAFSTVLTKFLNYASGGTEFKPGAIDISPDQIDYLIGQATGGVGREAMKIAQVTQNQITGEKTEPYKVPLAGRFYGETESDATTSARFYKNIEELNKHLNEIQGRLKSGQDIAKYMEENPDAAYSQAASKYMKMISDLKKERDLVKSNDGSKDAVKYYDTRITDVMKQLNNQIKEVKDRP